MKGNLGNVKFENFALPESEKAQVKINAHSDVL